MDGVAQGDADVFYRMTPFEIASGWLFGEVPAALPGSPGAPSLAETSASNPVQVLESMLAPALAQPPCVVAFSGGRDSSALLAVASRLAAREGLEPPVAATLRFPGEHEAHEEQWQELVVRHIGTSNWEKVPAGDSADLLGPVAAGELRRYGLLWPPAHHKDAPLCALAAGGTLVNGEGGDEVLGAHRVTPFARAIAGRLPKNRSEAAETALMVAPRPVRQRVYFTKLRAQVAKSWLRPEAQKHFAAAAAADKAAEPLHWSASLRRLPRMRAWNLGFHNQDICAAADRVTVLRPLQDARFLAALARSAPAWGFADRDTAMRVLFASLLPDELLRRPTKAVFNRVVFGEHSRAFVSRWNGGGVPSDLVDTEVLRRFWAAPNAHALSFSLLQSAWLAEQSTARPAERVPRP
jgi:asparagine synthetase B (glutamine-hydrolysing)